MPTFLGSTVISIQEESPRLCGMTAGVILKLNIMRFKVGQKVVCIREAPWDIGRGPDHLEIVTVLEMENIYYPALLFSEYGPYAAFNEKYFEPLMDIFELTEMLEIEPLHQPI